MGGLEKNLGIGELLSSREKSRHEVRGGELPEMVDPPEGV